MKSTTYMVAGQTFELQHHGVKGMKWGVRKTRKWATAKHQPSSARSSYLAGLYAATGNERVGKALDKSNDRDAANWQRAKERYKQISKNEATLKEARRQDAKRAMAYGTIAVTSFLAAYGAKTIADSRRSVSTGMLENTLSYVNAINKYYS